MSKTPCCAPGRGPRLSSSSSSSSWAWAWALALALLTGCAGSARVQVTPLDAQGWPEPAAACASRGAARPAPAACRTALLRALERGERRQAAQLLLALAPDATDPAAREAAARAALWLEPRPGVGADLRAPLTDALGAPLEDVEVSDQRSAPGAVLVLGDAPAPAQGPFVRVPLHIPPDRDPLGLSGAGLAQVVAAAAGAPAVIWQPTEGGPVWVTPAAPTLERHLGLVAPGVAVAADDPAALARALEAAARVHEADAAAWRGETMRAHDTLAEALAGYEALDAPPCSTLGALAQMAHELWPTASGISPIERAGLRARRCPEVAPADLDPAEALVGRYLRAYERLEGLTVIRRRVVLPDDWIFAADRQARARELRAVSDALGGRAGALLEAFTDRALRQAEALTAEGADRCALPDEAARRAHVAALIATLDALGRPDATGALRLDLATWTPTDAAPAPTGAPLTLSGWRALADDDDHRWLRTELLRRAVGFHANTERVLSPTALSALCADYLHASAADAAAERGQDVALRGATRVLDAFHLAAACQDVEALTALLASATDAAMASDEGHAAVLELHLRVALEVTWIGVFSDLHQTATERTVAALRANARRLVGALDDSPDARALIPALRLLDTLPTLLGGDLSATRQALENAARTWREVAAIDPVSGPLHRRTPALHLASLVALSLVDLATPAPDATALRRLRDALDAGAVERVADLDPQAPTEALRVHLEAFSDLMQAAPGERADPAWRARLEALPVSADALSWALTLRGLQVGLLDLHGALLWTAGLDGANTTWDAASALATAAVDDALARLPLGVATRQFISTLPLLHDLALSVLAEIDSLNGFDVGLLRRVAQQERDTWRDLARRISAGPDGADGDLVFEFSDMFLTLLLTDIALVAQGDSDARRVFSDHLAARAPLQPTDPGLLFDLGAATLIATEDAAASQALIARAAARVPDSRLPRARALPLLIELDALARRDDPPAEQLARVDALLALADEAAACEAHDPLHGLLPMRANLLLRLGRDDEARAALDRYAALLDAGFSGGGLLMCRFLAQRGPYSLELTVHTHLGGLYTPQGNGSFNFGAGAYSVWRDVASDRTVCSISALAPRRLELRMELALLRAALALRSGQPADAGPLLDDALATLQRMHSASFIILGEDHYGVGQGRDTVSSRALRWYATLFAAAGFPVAANQLGVAAQHVDAQRSTSNLDDEPGSKRRPRLLTGLDAFDPIDALAALLDPDPDDAPPSPAALGAALDAAGAAPFTTPYGLAAAPLIFRPPGADPAASPPTPPDPARLRALDAAAASPIEAADRQALHLQLASRSKIPAPPLPQDALVTLTTTLLEAGRDHAAVATLLNSTPDSLPLIPRFIDQVEAPALRAALVGLLLHDANQRQDYMAMGSLAAYLRHLGPGLIDPSSEINARVLELRLLIYAQRLAEARVAIDALLPMIQRYLPPEDGSRLFIEATDLALRLLTEAPIDPARRAELDRLTRLHHPDAAPLIELLDALASDDPARQRRSALTMLEAFLE